jgi:hypothetical protein
LSSATASASPTLLLSCQNGKDAHGLWEEGPLTGTFLCSNTAPALLLVYILFVLLKKLSAFLPDLLLLSSIHSSLSILA